MEFVPLLVMTALVKKVVDFAKYLTSGDVNAMVTQALAWVAGVLIAWAAAASDWGAEIVVNGSALSDLNAWSIIFAGVNLASLAGFGWDTLKAFDNTNSAAVPQLLAPHHATPQ